MFKEKEFVTSLGHMHSVNFVLYSKNNKRKTAIPTVDEIENGKPKTFTNQACYRNLVSGFKETNPDSIVAEFKPHKINKEKATKWLNLAKSNGYLPKYVNIKKTIAKGKLAFSLTRHTQNEWYIFLSIVRFLQAEPQLVLNALVLIDKGVSFDRALIVASKMKLDNSNHHFIPSSWCYLYLDTIEGVLNRNISENQVVSLRKFIDTMPTIKAKTKYFTGFDCNDTIEKISKKIKTEDTFKIIDHKM